VDISSNKNKIFIQLLYLFSDYFTKTNKKNRFVRSGYIFLPKYHFAIPEKGFQIWLLGYLHISVCLF